MNWEKTPAQLALAWVLSHPEITVAISGADTIEHLNDNIGAVGWTLDDSVRERLDAVSESFVGRPPRKFLEYLKSKESGFKTTRDTLDTFSHLWAKIHASSCPR